MSDIFFTLLFINSVLGFSDQGILVTTTGMAALATLINVGFEIGFKTSQNLGHIGRLAFYLYLGAAEDDLNPTPWFMYCTLPCICLYATSLLVYRTVKYGKNR